MVNALQLIHPYHAWKMKSVLGIIKKFQNCTIVDQDWYPIYTRRDSGYIIVNNGVTIDNYSVVSYNSMLLKKYMHRLILNKVTKVLL